ncbi:ATP synthase F1 subunit epsilon [Candidatus Saccharibacteria bacterium]|nr:ATP synthase F1 subunit epsilon [Candidatus Saccharibacteria bacterium]
MSKDDVMLMLQLISLTGEKFKEKVYEITLPTTSGEISVFPDHEALVTLAKPGAIAIRRRKTDPDDAREYFAISGGIVEIDAKRVRILVDEADYSDDIVEAEAEKALQRAIKLRDTAGSEVELEDALQQVALYSSKLKVAGLRRRTSRRRPSLSEEMASKGPMQ